MPPGIVGLTHEVPVLPQDFMEQLKSAYPARLGHQSWERVRVLVPRLVHTWNIPWNTILQGTRNYRLLNDRSGKTGSEYVLAAARFYDDRDKLVCEYAEMDMRTPAEIAAANKWTALEERAALVGVTVNRSQSFDIQQQAVNDAETREWNRKQREAGQCAPKFAADLAAQKRIA